MDLPRYIASDRSLINLATSPPLTATDAEHKAFVIFYDAGGNSYWGYADFFVSESSIRLAAIGSLPTVDTYLVRIEVVDNVTTRPATVTLSRTNLIVRRIQRRLKDLGAHDVKPDEIVMELDSVQVDLCREYFALKADATIDLTAGEDEYALDDDIFKVQEAIEPTTWRRRVDFIHDSKRWGDIVRNTALTASQPLFGFTWKRILRLKPVPAVSGEVLTLLAYALPANTLTIEADPEIGSEWDHALMLGGLKNLVGGSWEDEYKFEALKVSGQSLKESINGPIKKRHFTDRTRF